MSFISHPTPYGSFTLPDSECDANSEVYNTMDVRVRLYCHENESDTTFRLVHRESNLMLILSGNEDRRKNFFSVSRSVNDTLMSVGF